MNDGSARQGVSMTYEYRFNPGKTDQAEQRNPGARFRAGGLALRAGTAHDRG
jgi:hypothetical protein